MATNALQVNLLNDLKYEAGMADVGGEKIHLTPYLTLACALLYMVASDGELDAAESSHLQSVLGGDAEVLRYGVHYVQTLSFDGFLMDAPELLSMKDKWCILANVCDALLSDGQADSAELAQFSRLKQAFGVTDKQFEPFFKILALKNDKSVLGRYTGVRDERQPMTPHLALACALLYMLTSDGSIGAQEVGQLETVLGEFEGLQKAALTYVRSVKMNAFLDEASAALQPEQKLFILTNVCDSMLADGDVASIEDKLFMSMLRAFDFNEATFARFHQVIETKNVKPFSTNDFKNRVKHDRMTGNDEAEGEVFDNKLSDPKLAKAADELRDAVKEGFLGASAAELEMSQFISRQMMENRQNLNKDFNGQANIAKVESNATDGLNLQTIDVAAEDLNRQKIEGSALSQNKQLIEGDGADANRQQLDVEAIGEHRETIDPEVRAQNIHEVVGQVHKKLDHFERSNLSFLAIGRAQKITDDFVPIPEETSGINRLLVDASFARMGGGVFASNLVQAEGATPATTNTHAKTAASDHAGTSTNLSANPNPNASLSQGSLFPASQPAGLRLYRGHASLMQRSFNIAYKQIAVALATLVFASPIYTQSTKSRASVGPLVMMHQLVPELFEHRQALESGMADAQQLR
ncbi:hypothetical protein [Limnohabitans sp.]|uniref:TerB family tellurite resistance protein n=1 Tax=Limnohabitans sp. TaxID=1907725 RepID=UPI00286F5E74|nr:hypothetical protein [Limnohabitans sp.]